IRVLGAMGVAARMGAQVLSAIKSKRARELLELLARQLVEPGLEPHVEAVKPLLLGGPATAIKTVPVAPLKAGEHVVSNPVPAVRNKTQK
ncbi:hypothetical protein, partial [Pseudomonas marginalis]